MAYNWMKGLGPATSGDAFVNYNAFVRAGGGLERVYTDGATITISGTPTATGITNTIWNNNNYAGVVMELPDGRQFTIQRSNTGNTSRTWRVLYSIAAGFRDMWIQFSAGTFADGNTFTVNDGTTTKTFEYDTNATIVGGNVALTCTLGDSAVTLAATFIAAATTAFGATMTWVNAGSGLVYGVKTTRTGYCAVARTSGTPFSSWAPSATRLPVAYADQKAAWPLPANAGSDQSPSFADVLPVAGTYKQWGAFNGAAPYHHWMILSTNATGVITLHWFLDRSANMPTGEWDDVTWSIATTSPCNIISLSRENATSTIGWLGPSTNAGWGGLTSDYWLTRISGPSNQQVIPLNCPVSSFTEADDTPEPLMWLRRPASGQGNPGPYGDKGISTMVLWNTLLRPIGNLLSVNATGDYFCADSVALVGWDNTAVVP